MITDLDIPIAERLAKLIRLLGSDHDGEVLATVAALKRTLVENELDLHDVAAAIAGKKSERQVSEDLVKAYREGFNDGARQADDVDEHSWLEIARYCRAGADRLEGHERNFVEQMCRWAADGREMSDKQASWLLYLQVD
jgi:hypothetical protein